MNKKAIIFLITVLCVTFIGCDLMATLFHGEKPEGQSVTYTVTFNANGASGIPPQEHVVKPGTVVSLPDKGNLNSSGDTFVGWNESSKGGGITYSAGASITVTRNMVFYAQWLAGSMPQYTITFNANGATSGTVPVSQTVYSGTSITVPEHGTLAYSGKTFGGWNTRANGGGTNYEVGGFYTVIENVTLYAQWRSAAQYTVTYNSNGANGAAPSAQTVDHGTEITIQGEGSMTYTGKKFTGWNTQANGGGTNYAEGASYRVKGNIVFYAKWQDADRVTLNSVTANGSNSQTTTLLTLTFSQVITGLSADDISLNGVSGVTKGTINGSGHSYTLDISGFSAGGSLSVAVAKSDYIISGSPKTVTIYYNSGDISVTLNSVTANGSDSQTTTQLTFFFSREISGFNVDDISLSGVSGVIKGTLIRSGTTYTLDISGFSEGGTLNIVVMKSGYTISGSPKTVNIYKVVTVTVTFNSNGGGSLSSQTITSGSVASRPTAELTRTGYYFDYWYQDSGLTIPYYFNTPVTADITLYAKWVASNEITTMYEKNMVWIRGGTFTMGSSGTESLRNNEHPQHSVTMSGFYMSKYLVTQEQYQTVMGSNPSQFKSALTGESGTPGKLPVEYVNWYDTIVFCNKLSIMEGLSPAYNINGSTNPTDWGNIPRNDYNTTSWDAVTIVVGSNGYRLPTEAQWEYACRAGTTTAYNTGDTISSNTGWYTGNSDNKTHHVGKKPANAWGLYDMHGNVFEWCWDGWFRTYSSSAQTNPIYVLSLSYRIIRGGSWYDSADDMRSACRNGSAPYGLEKTIGFRLVRP